VSHERDGKFGNNMEPQFMKVELTLKLPTKPNKSQLSDESDSNSASLANSPPCMEPECPNNPLLKYTNPDHTLRPCFSN
jgi:hypothetical protein